MQHSAGLMAAASVQVNSAAKSIPLPCLARLFVLYMFSVFNAYIPDCISGRPGKAEWKRTQTKRNER
jgi:hypothetical protein